MDADIQRLVQAMPQHQEALNFLQRILDFQANLADRLETELGIEPAVAHEKWRAGHPLFAGESLPIPTPVFLQALADLRPLLPAGEAALLALDRLLASGLAEHLKSEHLVGDGDTHIQQLADATSSEPGALAFVLNTVLSPFLDKLARPYREWLGRAGWRKGICPVCGSEPWMARLASDDGRRILACSLCRTEWTFDRLRCPFCEGDDQPRLRHFVIEGDEIHRVYCCDRCRRYIKTVDERVSAGPANLLVEDVITAHLDTVAKEQGYH